MQPPWPSPVPLVFAQRSLLRRSRSSRPIPAGVFSSAGEFTMRTRFDEELLFLGHGFATSLSLWESVAKLGIRSLLKLRTELQASDIPLLAVMQGGEYRSPETHPLFVRAPTGTDSEFCNTLSWERDGREAAGEGKRSTLIRPFGRAYRASLQSPLTELSPKLVCLLFA